MPLSAKIGVICRLGETCGEVAEIFEAAPLPFGPEFHYPV